MKITIVLIFVLFLLGSCSKDDEVGFTSLIGSWTYTTPDNKIEVTFDIVGGSDEILNLKDQTIVVDGVEGKAEIQSENITETTIGRVRINANDASLVYAFNITFNKLSANTDFTEINVESASYTWPWSPTAGPTINALENIKIVRK